MMNVDPSLPMLTTEQIQKCLEENKELIMAILEGQNQGKFGEIAPYQARLQHNLTFLAKLADVGPQADPQAQTNSQGQGMQQQQPHAAMSQQRSDLSTVNSAFDMNEQQQQQPHVAMSQQRQGLSTFNLAFDMNEQQQPHVAMSQQRPGLSTFNSAFDMNEQRQQPHVAMSQQRPCLSTVNSDFDMNEQQQQQHLAMSLQQPDFSTSKMGFQLNEQHHKLPAFYQQHQLFPEGVNSFTGTNYSGMQTRTCYLPDTPSFNQMGSDVSPGWS